MPSLALAGAPRGLAAGFFSLDGGRVEVEVEEAEAAVAAAGWTLPPGSTMVLITTAKNKSTRVKEPWIGSSCLERHPQASTFMQTTKVTCLRTFQLPLDPPELLQDGRDLLWDGTEQRFIQIQTTLGQEESQRNLV